MRWEGGRKMGEECGMVKSWIVNWIEIDTERDIMRSRLALLLGILSLSLPCVVLSFQFAVFSTSRSTMSTSFRHPFVGSALSATTYKLDGNEIRGVSELTRVGCVFWGGIGIS